jgi:hypothetical protein
LGSPPALASPEGQTSITGTARFVPATFYIASLPFQDTPQNGGYSRRSLRWLGYVLCGPGVAFANGSGAGSTEGLASSVLEEAPYAAG